MAFYGQRMIKNIILFKVSVNYVIESFYEFSKCFTYDFKELHLTENLKFWHALEWPLHKLSFGLLNNKEFSLLSSA